MVGCDYSDEQKPTNTRPPTLGNFCHFGTLFIGTQLGGSFFCGDPQTDDIALPERSDGLQRDRRILSGAHAMKRFGDCKIWAKQWHRKWPLRIKSLWRYLYENCDHAGVWEQDWELASLQIGETVGPEDIDALNSGNGESDPARVIVLDNGKLWLSGFMSFQYGRLSEECRAHGPVIVSIEKNKLWNLLPDSLCNSLSNRHIVIDKDKDRDKDKDKNKGALPDVTLRNPVNAVGDGAGDVNAVEKQGKRFKPPTPEEVEAYGRSIGYKINGRLFVAHYAATGWKRGKTQIPITRWKACVQTWKENDNNQPKKHAPTWGKEGSNQ